MKLSAILAPLIAAKADHELIMAQIVAFEKEQESTVDQGKEKARARWHKWNDKRLQTLANVSGPLTHRGTRGEDNLLPKKITRQEENKKDTPQAALETVLDAEHAAAVIEHRQKLRTPLTAYAARKLATQFSATPNPNEAADAMIEGGWRGFKPEWLNNRASSAHRGGTGPPQEIRTVGELAIHRLETGQSRDEPTGYASGSMDQGFERGQAESPRGAQLIAFAAKSFGRIE